ncbi:MAG: response regulator [Elusimicrobia bacterium]|nr:response regulator [Candidatus Liberimonas magnetica]
MANEKILVVDDEENIRGALEEYLKSQGYNVQAACDGYTAISMFEKNEYDLVFLDIRMPGIDGIETLGEMKKRKPKSKVVIVSGVPDEVAFERAASIVDGTIEGFIAKPFKPSDIRKCLDKVLAGEKMPVFALTSGQENALIKIGASGAENASRALARVLGKQVSIGIGKVKSYSLNKILTQQKTEETIIGGIAQVEGNIKGKLLTLLSWESGLGIIKLKTGAESSDFNAPGIVIIKSVAMVLATSYLIEVAKALAVTASTSLPALFFDTEKAVLELAMKDFIDEHVFALETELTVQQTNIKSRVLLLPDIDSLKVIFKAMSVLQ